MRRVPYHGNPGNACALACYTMAAQYLLPNSEITFEELGKIAGWREGYVVWGFSTWKWMMDQRIHIDAYDAIDVGAWADRGIVGLREAVSPKEFEYYRENTYDLEAATKELSLVSNHPNFTYHQERVSWERILQEVAKPGICDITLDGRKLHRTDGFTIHRVIIIEITDSEVVLHDPVKNNDGAYRQESIQHFRSAIDSLRDGPELVRYYSENEERINERK